MNCKNAGVKQIRVHDFRHSCASLLINNGASITLVAKYLGHTKVDETLNTYSHMYQNKLEDIVNLMNIITFKKEDKSQNEISPTFDNNSEYDFTTDELEISI